MNENTDGKEGELNMTQHTPGPWMWWDSCSWRRLGTADQSTHIMEPIVQKDGHPDLHFHNGGYRGPDARLIAAAPEMHGVLKNHVLPLLNRHADSETNRVWGEVAKVLSKLDEPR